MDWWASLNNLIYVVTGALAGAIAFLVRKVLTNDKEIALLKNDLEQRNEQRKERDDLINDQLLEIRSDIKRLIGKMNFDYNNNA